MQGGEGEREERVVERSMGSRSERKGKTERKIKGLKCAAGWCKRASE